METAPHAGTPVRRQTYRDYAALPEGAPYQLVEGELLMTPSPVSGHQRTLGALFGLLQSWSERAVAGEVFIAPFDVILDDENVLQPDLIFVSTARASIVQDWCRGAPDLVVEVLSPSNAALDRTRKTKVYARFGVPRVWLVDPTERTFECLKLEKEGYLIQASFAEEDVARPPGFEGFEIPLSKIWPAKQASPAR